jgi:hypothetical protein
VTDLEWLACVNVLRHTYGQSFKLDADGIEVWGELLADLPGERVRAAVVHLCRTVRAFPSVADLRAFAEPQQVDAAEAWGLACRWAATVQNGTRYQAGDVIPAPGLETLPFAVARAVRALGGATAINARTYDDEMTMRAHFFRAYEGAKKSAAHDETFAALGVGDEGPARLTVGLLGAVARPMPGGAA